MFQKLKQEIPFFNDKNYEKDLMRNGLFIVGKPELTLPLTNLSYKA